MRFAIAAGRSSRSVVCRGRRRERLRDRGELRERGFEVLDDLLRDDLRRREVLEILERLVAEPDEVEADLVALEELVVGEALEALRLAARCSGPRAEYARDEVSEMLVAGAGSA